jgi:LPS O-antigen subunit length determinant protein (WzzB/FepE family)
MEERSKNVSTDDIDLIALLVSIIRFIKSYRIILISVTFLGVLAGYLTYLTIPKYYTTKSILQPAILTKQEFFQVVNNWSELRRTNNDAELAQRFNCDPHLFNKIGSITAQEIPKTNLQAKAFILSATVKDTTVIPALQKAVISGFENNEYIKEQLADQRGNLKQLIEKISIEMQKLENLKLQNIDSGLRSNTNSRAFMLDISNINSQIVILLEKKVKYETDLKFANAVQVLQNFSRPDIPDQPKLRSLLILGFICGAFIGFIISVYKQFMKKYSHYL